MIYRGKEKCEEKEIGQLVENFPADRAGGREKKQNKLNRRITTKSAWKTGKGKKGRRTKKEKGKEHSYIFLMVKP